MEFFFTQKSRYIIRLRFYSKSYCVLLKIQTFYVIFSNIILLTEFFKRNINYDTAFDIKNTLTRTKDSSEDTMSYKITTENKMHTLEDNSVRMIDVNKRVLCNNERIRNNLVLKELAKRIYYINIIITRQQAVANYLWQSFKIEIWINFV